ncbi:MAG: DNA polymerase III subunit beta [SAR202 cluster bacterium]|mgnify:FL=1|nr:DNA polymerase III subunit beta [SAR202 cluster bacterium]|tara:strand:- start:84741 stop:85874 length:1134 start_codon:yes stop_codon:yes gene_type:complete
MRLLCLQENLNKGLGIVSRAVPTRTTLPVTQNVLITTDNGKIKLVTTNLEIAISTWVGAQIEDGGSVAVPAKLLSELVNSLPSGQINISNSNNSAGIEINCDKFNSQVNGTNPDDFPPIPTVNADVIATVDSKIFQDAITRVSIAAATDESRPVLTGIKMELEDDNFTLAGADGFRLAVYRGKLLEKISEKHEFILPSKSLQEINRIIVDQDEPIVFSVTPSKNQAMFKLSNVEIVTQLVQGTFPNYSQLIPESSSTKTEVSVEEFQRAAKTASVFARDGSGILRLHLNSSSNENPEKLLILSRSEEIGENESQIEAKVDGEDAKIAFNSKYLTDVLSVIKENKVIIETTSPSSPGVIRPLGQENYTHVVMPMFVQW